MLKFQHLGLSVFLSDLLSDYEIYDLTSKLYPIKWTHLFHNFLLFGHRFFIGIPINRTYFLFKTLFLRHTFACVSSIIGLHTEVIQMTNYHCPTRFTPEQMKILSANPFTYKVSAIDARI